MKSINILILIIICSMNCFAQDVLWQKEYNMDISNPYICVPKCMKVFGDSLLIVSEYSTSLSNDKYLSHFLYSLTDTNLNKLWNCEFIDSTQISLTVQSSNVTLFDDKYFVDAQKLGFFGPIKQSIHCIKELGIKYVDTSKWISQSAEGLVACYQRRNENEVVSIAVGKSDSTIGKLIISAWNNRFEKKWIKLITICDTSFVLNETVTMSFYNDSSILVNGCYSSKSDSQAEQCFLLKLSPLGDIVFFKKVNISGYYNFCNDGRDNFFIGQISSANDTIKHISLTKIDCYGNVIWNNSSTNLKYSAGGVSRIIPTLDSGAVVLCYDDPLLGTASRQILLKVDKNGNNIWVMESNSQDSIVQNISLEQCANGNYYLLSLVKIPGTDNPKAIITKFRDGTYNSVAKTGHTTPLLAVPTPFTDEARIEFDVEQAGAVSVLVRNSMGELVAQREYYSQSGRQSFSLTGAELPAGIYFCDIVANGKTYRAKAVLVR